MMARCELTELLVEQCAHCRRIPDPPQRRIGRAFPASYRGRCHDCGTAYEPGTVISRVDDADDDVGYIGHCCREAQE